MDRGKLELLRKVLDVLEEESYGGEAEEDKEERSRLEELYDPGYARLRKLGWPGCNT